MSSPHPRRFRFGVELERPFEGLTWAQSARELEAMGYSTLFVPDHLHSGFGPITAMATAVAATTTLVVAPLVMACDLRNPAVVAKELASIDVLSGGRIEVGLGAGYNPLDYSRTGIPMDAPGVRVSRLIEHVQVLRACFGGGTVDFHGEHYDIEGLDATPVPATPGGPPIIVAGGGPRLLRFAAGAADVVGINPTTAAGRNDPRTALDAMPASIDAKVALVREAAGDRWESLELNAWISLAAITDRAADVAEGMARFSGAPVSDVLASPIVLVGTVDEVVERLVQRRERWGYSYVALPATQARAFAPVVEALAGR